MHIYIFIKRAFIMIPFEGGIKPLWRIKTIVYRFVYLIGRPPTSSAFPGCLVEMSFFFMWYE